MKKEKNTKNNEVVDKKVIDVSELNEVKPEKVVDMKKERENETDNEAIRSVKEEITGERIKEIVEMPRSQPIGYYLKHEINKELINGLVDNHKYNDSLLTACLGKTNNETHNCLPTRPVYNAILNKKLVKKENMEGNFVIPCNIGGLKNVNALVDQGSDVNVMPLSIYNRLTDEITVGTSIRLFIASHSYIFPSCIDEDLLVEIADYVYLVDFVILDIKEDKKKPFILGTTF
nr:hypothetical protein [Tanacetum cinerariifolium]